MKALKGIIAAVLCIGLLIPMTGCFSQSTTAQLISIVGNSVASLVAADSSITGSSNLSTQLTTDFAAASTLVANWKAGTPSQDVVQALNLVEKDLNLIPVDDQTKVFITLAIATVDSIVAVVQPAASGNLSVAQAKTSNVVTVKQYKNQWNALVTVHPKFASARLR